MIGSLMRGANAFTAAFLKKKPANLRPRTVREMCGLVAAVHDVWSDDTAPPQDEEAIFNPDVLHTTSQILHHRKYMADDDDESCARARDVSWSNLTGSLLHTTFSIPC